MITAGGFDTSTGRYTSEATARSMGSSFYQPEGGQERHIPSAPTTGKTVAMDVREPQTYRQPESSITGAIVGGVGAGVMGAIADIGAPFGEYNWRDVLPGGAPFRVPDLPTADHDIVKTWWTGTAVFALDSHGHYWVTKKVRRTGWPDTYIWKRYTQKKPTVIGNKMTTKNIKKAITLMKKFKKVQKDLNTLLPKRRSYSRKVC